MLLKIHILRHYQNFLVLLGISNMFGLFSLLGFLVSTTLGWNTPIIFPKPTVAKFTCMKSNSRISSSTPFTITFALALLTTNPPPISASVETLPLDSTVYLDNIVTSLKYSQNNPSPTSTVYKTFEDIRDTITDGKGVGGAVDSKGVQLSRGVVSGEDQVSERRRGGGWKTNIFS